MMKPSKLQESYKSLSVYVESLIEGADDADILVYMPLHEILDWARQLEEQIDDLLNKLVAGEELYISRGIEIAQLETKNERLREYYEAHMAIEHGLADFELHNNAVVRLEKARDALKEVDDAR